MSADPVRSIYTGITVSIQDADIIRIDETQIDECFGVAREMRTQRLLNTRTEKVRSALIELGWAPPNEPEMPVTGSAQPKVDGEEAAIFDEWAQTLEGSLFKGRVTAKTHPFYFALWLAARADLW